MAGIGIESIVGKVLKMDGDSGDPDRFLRVSVIIDESVTPALIEHARSVLKPVTGNVRMTIESYYDEPVSVSELEDLAIVLANDSMWTGAVSSIAWAKGVPCVVVAEHLSSVVAHAEATGFPIDYENIVSPEAMSAGLPGILSIPGPISQIATVGLGVAENIANFALRDVPERLFGRVFSIDRINLVHGTQPPCMTETYDRLFDEVGEWVVRNCEDLAGAFARAYEFSRKPLAMQLTRKTAFENAISGAAFFVSKGGFPVMTLNELRMLLRIERAYGHGIDKQMLIEAAAVILVGFACKLMAKGLCKSLPVLTWLIKTSVAYCATYAIGLAMRGHCESGRNLPPVVVMQLRRFAPKLLPEHLRG